MGSYPRRAGGDGRLILEVKEKLEVSTSLFTLLLLVQELFQVDYGYFVNAGFLRQRNEQEAA